jgi:HSP20 family molecular chaperone IbpA
MKKNIIILSVFAGLLSISYFPSFAVNENAEDLKKQIEILQKRVELLEEKNEREQEPITEEIPLKRWDPFEEISSMQHVMDKMLQDSFYHRGNPNKGMFKSNMLYDADFKIQDEKDKYVIRFDMTGSNKDKLDIQVNPRAITVKGEREEKQVEQDQGQYLASSSYSSFMRAIPIPLNADTSKMETEIEGEELIITLQKKS